MQLEKLAFSSVTL
uniref:Uncharacterized protein n=1 Tax=Anguilla anguilla TaxID=7936 RepID=A0A0E9PRC0_ANGAN